MHHQKQPWCLTQSNHPITPHCLLLVEMFYLITTPLISYQQINKSKQSKLSNCWMEQTPVHTELGLQIGVRARLTDNHSISSSYWCGTWEKEEPGTSGVPGRRKFLEIWKAGVRVEAGNLQEMNFFSDYTGSWINLLIKQKYFVIRHLI